MIIEDYDKFKQELKKVYYKLLGLDIGDRKIGLATVSSEIKLPTTSKTIIRNNINNDLGQIASFTEQNNIDGLVIGLPLSLDGKENKACQKIRKFAAQLTKKITLPITFHDERYTTSMAHSIGSEFNISRKQRNKTDDQIAACLILESFIKKIG